MLSTIRTNGFRVPTELLRMAYCILSFVSNGIRRRDYSKRFITVVVHGARNSENKCVPSSVVPKTTAMFTTANFSYSFQRDRNGIVPNSVIRETIRFLKMSTIFVRKRLLHVRLLFALFVSRPVRSSRPAIARSQVGAFGRP